MKKNYAFSLLIILSLFFVPIQISYAALVPVKKTSPKTTKRIQKRKLKRAKNTYKHHWSVNQKKQAPKPEQQKDYEGVWALLITILVLYFGTGLTLLIVGLALMIPGLWIAGVVVLSLPFLAFLIYMLISAIQNANYEKRKIDRVESE